MSVSKINDIKGKRRIMENPITKVSERLYSIRPYSASREYGRFRYFIRFHWCLLIPPFSSKENKIAYCYSIAWGPTGTRNWLTKNYVMRYNVIVVRKKFLNGRSTWNRGQTKADERYRGRQKKTERKRRQNISVAELATIKQFKICVECSVSFLRKWSK